MVDIFGFFVFVTVVGGQVMNTGVGQLLDTVVTEIAVSVTVVVTVSP